MQRFIKNILSLLVVVFVLSGCAGTGGLGLVVPERLAGLMPAAGHAEVDPATQARFDEAVKQLRDGDAARAEALFESLAQAHPGLAGPHVNLALIRLEKGQLGEAEASAARAVRLNPASAPAHNALGIVLRRQGRFPEAEAAYQAALEQDAEYALAWRNLGVLYDLYLQRPHEALAAYQRFQALVAEPDREVAMWIDDLTRRFGVARRAARVTQP